MKTKILLIGIDGLILNRAFDAGVAPTLMELKNSGFFTELVVEVPTLSGPSWSTLLTGSTHAQHLVSDNRFAGHNLLHRPDLLSRAFYQDQSTKTFAAAGWPPLVDPAGLGPVIHERQEQQRGYKHRVIVRDGETYGYEKVDAEIANISLYAITGFGPDVSFVYFCGVDEAGHAFGSTGAHYLEAIKRVDTQVAHLKKAVEERANLQKEKWIVVVTTDHGHLDQGGHGGDSSQERASFVIANGFGRENPKWPNEFAPEDLVELLLNERK